MYGLNFQRKKPVYSKNIQEYEKIFFSTLFRLANNYNQLFVHNTFETLDFSQQKKIAKYFARFSKLLQKFQQQTVLEIDYQIQFFFNSLLLL